MAVLPDGDATCSTYGLADAKGTQLDAAREKIREQDGDEAAQNAVCEIPQVTVP